MDFPELKETLRSFASPERAEVTRSFFKMGPGEYSEGDQFLGIRIPDLRSLVKKANAVTLRQAVTLLHSEWHEERFMGLLLMENRFEHAGEESLQEEIVKAYLANTRWVNNWDLVDASAPSILGAWLLPRKRSVLMELVRSENLWERRIAIVSTLTLIRAGEFVDTLRLTERLLGDPEDLMHKACGWMLREVGKKDRDILIFFLGKHAPVMPRTMLRYAIERFPQQERRAWLDSH
ncbi:MAG: DNA alkylation repair protein [Proteobacteria bacterium]|nr:DNA alkylation repair protein [Pseudomonadota bacterium]